MHFAKFFLKTKSAVMSDVLRMPVAALGRVQNKTNVKSAGGIESANNPSATVLMLIRALLSLFRCHVPMR